jgi:predicted acyltransferase
MYDPEGTLSTLPTVATVLIGAHFGRALLSDSLGRRPLSLVAHWAAVTATLSAFGVALLLLGVRSSKQMWTPTFLTLNAAMDGAILLVVYMAVDLLAARRAILGQVAAEGGRSSRATALAGAVASAALAPLRMLGMNAIISFVVNATVESVVNAIYLVPVDAPGAPLAWERGALLGPLGVIHEKALAFVGGPVARETAYALLKVLVFLLAAKALHAARIFVKI